MASFVVGSRLLEALGRLFVVVVGKMAFRFVEGVAFAGVGNLSFVVGLSLVGIRVVEVVFATEVDAGIEWGLGRSLLGRYDESRGIVGYLQYWSE